MKRLFFLVSMFWCKAVLAFQNANTPMPAEETTKTNYWWWIAGVVIVIAAGMLLYVLIKKDPKRDAT